jgi:hypothetical protein
MEFYLQYSESNVVDSRPRGFVKEHGVEKILVAATVMELSTIVEVVGLHQL